MKMKKIIALLLMVWSTAYGQVYTPMAQNYEFKRHIKIDSTLNMAQAYADTTAANTAGSGLVAGRLIRIGNDFWMRNTALTAWLQFVNTGPGSTSSDAVWETDGNYSATDPTTFKLGHIDSFPLRLYTNDVKRLEIPANGIQSVNGSQYRYLVYDTSGAILGYTSGLDTILVGRGIQKDSTGPGSSTIYLDSAYYTTVVHGDSTFGLRYNGDSTLFSVAGGGGATGWSLTGNAGTTAGTNFVGTTDDVDLVFKRNGVVAGKLSALEENTFFGESAGLSMDNGGGNSLFGAGAGNSITDGNYNSINGGFAGQFITIGESNTISGYGASGTMVTGNRNSLYGWNSNVSANNTDSSGAFGAEATASTRQMAFSPYFNTMFLDLDSASGTAPAIAGIDKDGNWRKYATPSGGGGTPAGNYGNIQINRNGAFDTPGGDSLSFDQSIPSFNIIGGIKVSDAVGAETSTQSEIKTTNNLILGDLTNGVYVIASGSNADNNLRLYSTGGNPIELHDDVTVIGNITAHNIIGATATQTDANFSATAGTAYVLSGNNSATRTITMPTLAEGDVFEFYNENTSANKWVSSATIYLSDNTTFTTLADDTNYILRYVGGKLRVSN